MTVNGTIRLCQDLNSTNKIIFIHTDVLQYRINGCPERHEDFSDVGEIFMPSLSVNVRYDRLFVDHELDKVIAPQPEADNYLTLAAETETLTVKFFLPNGDLI